MPRRLLVLSLLTLLLLAPASTAWARGGGWEPLNNQPFTLEACGTTVDVTYPVKASPSRARNAVRSDAHARAAALLSPPRTI